MENTLGVQLGLGAKVAKDFSDLGFQHPNNLIMAFVGGSQLHGAKIAGTDDTDWFGVYIEPSNDKLGIMDYREHFVYTTGGERGGNGPNDVDVCLYTLGKWARLVCKGNPSSLHFIFAKPVMSNWAWEYMTSNKEIYLAKRHIKAYLGFANDQYKRLIGEKGQKNIHRAELEELHGYDTKYAMHIVRLYEEALELMENGTITLPRPNAQELIAIRMGKYKLTEFMELIKDLAHKALSAAQSSQLPDYVDVDTVSDLVVQVYKKFWEYHNL